VSKQSLLLVDGDTRSLRVLEVSLRKAGFTVTPAASVQDALDKLELHAPDLIISETTFPEGDGFELRRRVRQTPDWAEIPFIFLTAEAAIENKIRGLELGVDDYLTKPIYIKEIVTRINILLQKKQRTRFEERKDGRTRFAGRVADMPVVDVIQTIEISRKSGVIQFVGDRGRQAAIYFRDGKVIDAEAGTLQGEDAVYRLLTWSEGEFEVVFRTVRRREVIAASSQGLLMEGMRRLDEWSRLLEQLPPLAHRFEIDANELAVRLGEVPDDNNKILRLIDGKRTLIEVIDASDFGDLECLQAIARLYFEELLIDIDHDKPRRRETGKPIPLVEVIDPPSAPRPASPAHSGEIALLGDDDVLEAKSDTGIKLPIEPVAAAEPTPAPAPAPEPEPEPTPAPEADEPGPLMGGYRPSSLRLIDEAVAAAQLIEPSLFADDISTPIDPIDLSNEVTPVLSSSEISLPPEEVVHDASNLTVEEVATHDSVPHEIQADEPSPPPRRKPKTSAPPPMPRREESGLRMIGSLGRDRAEASGQIALGMSLPQRTETQRELVTILPRRATREVKVIPATPASTSSSSETAQSAPPVEPPPSLPAPPRVTTEGTGVVSKAGPGMGGVALIVLAALLAGTAMFLWLKGKKSTERQVATVHDAQVVEPARAPDAQVASAPVDAVEAAVPDAKTVAHVVDAAPVVVDAAPLTPAAQAKALYQQSLTALQKGEIDKALALTEQSIQLHRTARAYIVRAQAMQKQGRTDDALSELAEAESLAPDYAQIWDIRGGILWGARRWDEAHQAYDQYLKLDPDSSRAEQIRQRLAEPH
jgi:CheY-like chemotaxis protein